MKKIIIILGVVIAALGIGYFGMRAFTKRSSPEATALYNKNGLNIKVEYCRPSRKGRVIFGELEPYGKVWRTGANEATEISFNKPVNFGGKPVEAGTYTLFTIPQKERWTVILNRELDQWGAFSYNEEKDALRVEVSAHNTPEVTEMFTIDFVDANNGVEMQLMWDQTKVAVPIAAR